MVRGRYLEYTLDINVMAIIQQYLLTINLILESLLWEKNVCFIGLSIGQYVDKLKYIRLLVQYHYCT